MRRGLLNDHRQPFHDVGQDLTRTVVARRTTRRRQLWLTRCIRSFWGFWEQQERPQSGTGTSQSGPGSLRGSLIASRDFAVVEVTRLRVEPLLTAL